MIGLNPNTATAMKRFNKGAYSFILTCLRLDIAVAGGSCMKQMTLNIDLDLSKLSYDTDAEHLLVLIQEARSNVI